MNKRISLLVLTFTVISSGAWAVELWNGFTTDMTPTQVINRARSLRPREEYLTSTSSIFNIYGGDKKALNSRFKQTNLSIGFNLPMSSLVEKGANAQFYFLNDKLYAIRLVTTSSAELSLSQIQKEYGKYNEVVTEDNTTEIMGMVIKNIYKVYFWKTPKKLIFVKDFNESSVLGFVNAGEP